MPSFDEIDCKRAPVPASMSRVQKMTAKTFITIMRKRLMTGMDAQ